MNRIATYFTLLLLTASFAAGGQNVIVLDASTQVVCSSAKKATVTNRRVYKLLNEHSEWASKFTETCTKHDKLTSFEAIVTDEAGKVIKTVKKGDLRRTEVSGEMASDIYTMYYDYTAPRFPVTVEFKWTTEMDGSVLMFPAFVPAEGYDVQVDKATYSLTVPAEMNCRYKVLNSSIAVTKSNDGKNDRFTAEVRDMKHIESEPVCESARKVLPMVYFAPSQFEYLGYSGNASTWRDFGAWIHSLREGRTQLSPETQAAVRAMTDTCTTQRSRLAVLYNHLEKTTRYVSIQLGIGGMQPFAAGDVCRTGFGDCKGLSNYMCAMLECVGITPLYAIISTRNDKLLGDFSSANQFNHAIAGAVIDGDTTWLECTNPKLPLGYVHDGIAGHQALLITAEGGKVVTLPQYTASQNMQSTRLDVTLDAAGSATMHFVQQSACDQYEDNMSLIYREERDKRIAVQKRMLSPGVTLDQLTITEDKTPFATPVITIDAQAQTPKYASAMGSRLLVPVNTLRESSKPRDMNGTRKLPVELVSYLDVDTITVTIPEGYAVEALPAPVEVSNKMGSFSTTTTADGATVTTVTKRSMNAGVYPPEDYNLYYELKRTAHQAYQQKMTLKRQ
ncbi:MAG: DUF3857 domain-containing protein [Muribaculaceae bacterium]|nr:DUF3857 domain-containing protein [Muribaculaceae bacterium]